MKESRIFNLADIHFRDKPDPNDFIGKRNDSYFKSIEKMIISNEPTHIIINGDMVFNAKPSQYEQCYKILLYEYLNNHESVRLILTPGNHSIQRALPKIILSKCGLKFNNIAPEDIDPTKLLYSEKQEIENIIREKFNSNELLARDVFGELAKNYTEIGKYDDFLRGKDFKLFELLFFPYSQFVNEYVIKRFDEINSRERKGNGDIIEFESYRKSQGLHGVIYDKEYNLVFACLNGVSYAWGSETFADIFNSIKDWSDKDSLNDLFKRLYQEYGNLGLGTSAKEVSEDLLRLRDTNKLNQSAVLLLSHVPISWLNYFTVYKDEHLKSILEVIDIALFGHVHVSHFDPTIYRNRTYVFESPQLYNFKFEKLTSDKIVGGDYVRSLGFSIFSFFKNNNEFSYTAYKLSSEDNFIIRNGDYKFIWVGLDDSFRFLRPKKTIFTCYNCLGSEYKEDENQEFVFLDNCSFSKFLKSEATFKIYDINDTIRIGKEYLIDFKTFCFDKISDRNYPSKFESGKILNYIINDTTMLIFPNIESNDSLDDIFKILETFLCQLRNNELINIKNIKICVFDYNLFYIFARGTEKTIQNSIYWNKRYIEWVTKFDDFGIKFKANFFSFPTKNKDCFNQNKSLFDIGIGFEVIDLIEYKNYIISK